MIRMNIYKDFAQVLLPEGILDYYELTDFKKEENSLLIFLEEKAEIPPE